MADKSSFNKNITSTPLYVILIEWTFLLFSHCNVNSTTVPFNGIIQFTFFLIMRWNITIVTSCYSLKMDWWNTSEMSLEQNMDLSNFLLTNSYQIVYGHHKYILEIKERLLIKRDKPVLNKNISSTKLFLFDNNLKFKPFYYTVMLFYYVIWYVVDVYNYVSYETFWNKTRKFDFIIPKQSLYNECRITFEMLENN